MKSRFTLVLSLASFVLLCLAAGAPGAERLDRGLVAMECEDGSVFLSWRLLETDPQDMAFRIIRIPVVPYSRLPYKILTGDKPYLQTNFVDKSPEPGLDSKTCEYRLYRYSEEMGLSAWEQLGGVFAELRGRAKPYVSIPLDGNYDFQKVGVADLDGDGAYEYIIKQPNFNTDPYQQPGYWKKSTTTYKLEAYRPDGTMMWRYDMGWSVEAGIWYSPWIVYDVDGDGRAEVYCKAGEGDPRDEKGLVQTGPEYLVKLDGQTGKVIAKTAWLTRDGFSQYNYYCRNFLTVAYLDGKTPSLIIQRGTYNLIKMQALDKDFNQIWYWETTHEKEKYSGQSGHGLITADIDEDGRDELVMGAAVIDDNGKGIWTLGMGHPDVAYVADINPDNPGLEIFYGIEPRQNTDAICIVDAKTGRKLWAHKEPTRHVHGQGMAADVLADSPGMEVYAGERDLKQRWLYSDKGKLLEFTETGTLNPRALWWDADPQKEVIISNAVRDWGGEAMQTIEGQVIAVIDCLGDYREEAITCLKGELRIYTTTVPTRDRRVCLMQDHQYRMGVVAQTMGYYYPAQLGK
ncbi:MAG: silent information regulator protein Sir2 [Planctomycetota bacterium]